VTVTEPFPGSGSSSFCVSLDDDDAFEAKVGATTDRPRAFRALAREENTGETRVTARTSMVREPDDATRYGRSEQKSVYMFRKKMVEINT